MKKIFYRTAALVLAAFLLLCACGQGNVQENAAEESEAEQIEKIEILIGYDGDEKVAEEVRKIADGFNSSQDVYVAAVDETAGEWKTGEASAEETEGEPKTGEASVVFMSDDAAAGYANDDSRLDIRPYLESDAKGSLYDVVGTLPENMYETVCDETRGLFYLPISVTAPVLYYNKTIYDEAGLILPKSYSNLRDNCLAIYSRYRIPGYLPYDLAGDVIAMMKEQEQISAKQSAGTDQTSETLQSADADQAGAVLPTALSDAAVLQLFAGSCEAGYFRMVQHEAFAALDFNTGAVAAYAGTPSEYAMASENAAFEVGAIPWVMDSEDAVYWVDSDGMMFFDRGEEKNGGAVAFAQYALGDEVCSAYLEAVGGISPYASICDSQPYRKNRRGFDAITEAVSAEIPRADIMMLSDEKRREIEELLLYIIDDSVTAEDAAIILDE